VKNKTWAVAACLLPIFAGAANLPEKNPWVEDSPYAISHHDPAQTDSTVVEGASIGKKLSHADARYVTSVWCSAPIYKLVGDDIIVVASTPLGIIKIRATGEDYSLVSNVPYPGREAVHAANPDEKILKVMEDINNNRREKQDFRLLLNSLWMYYKLDINMRTMPSGAYAVIDKEGYHYTNYDKFHLVKSFDDNQIDQPLLPVSHSNIVAQLPADIAEGIDKILGINMTYDGYIVAAATGALIVVDRELKVKSYVTFPGEHVENSIAIDEDNGIYVVTSKYMRKIVWTGDKLSTDEADGAWGSAYDVMPEGEAQKMGAASHGSGTTPSLLGFGDDPDKLVVISDGNAKNAQIVAFWREQIPEHFEQKPGTKSRRIADQIPLAISKTTIEASLVTYDNGVLALNTTFPDPSGIPQDLISSAFLAGTTRPAPVGIQKFEWLVDENRFIATWSDDTIDNTDWMPPVVSAANGLVYIANKSNNVYEYLAADWKTGEIKAVWEFPDDSVRWNNWGGITVLLPDGDLLLGGFFATKRYDIGGLRPSSQSGDRK
jgi:hypothetical protein